MWLEVYLDIFSVRCSSLGVPYTLSFLSSSSFAVECIQKNIQKFKRWFKKQPPSHPFHSLSERHTDCWDFFIIFKTNLNFTGPLLSGCFRYCIDNSQLDLSPRIFSVSQWHYPSANWNSVQRKKNDRFLKRGARKSRAKIVNQNKPLKQFPMLEIWNNILFLSLTVNSPKGLNYHMFHGVILVIKEFIRNIKYIYHKVDDRAQFSLQSTLLLGFTNTFAGFLSVGFLRAQGCFNPFFPRCFAP